MFNFFRQNNLFTKCQSGFIPGDSCVAQLLSITHEIYQSFDCSPTRDVKGVLIRFGMNVYFLNYSLMESTGIF